jgi:hypothetical protein
MESTRDSWQTMADALRRATLGEYEILGELGRGGMATVYLAHDIALDRKVAIKVLAPALLLTGEGMVERFKREARTAAALSHPHIIPIFAVKDSHRIIYFVMKYVQGRSLDAVIHDVGRLPIPMVQAILAQVGDALGYAHRQGVVHRDIKSANIMIDDEGWAVVTDFGIAKVQEAQGLTLSGVTVGTPAYMSPEQCASREVTGATDQYSLGVVAYEMLTGRLPFQGASGMSMMYAHFNEPAPSVTELRSDCPPNLATAVMRMLEKEPEDRWPTMEDVVAVCGRPSLRHDDPIRSEMITLARPSRQARSLAEMQVPTSPVALAKVRVRADAGARGRATRRWWWVLGAAAGLAALLVWQRAWRLSGERPTFARDSVVAPEPVRPVPVARPRVNQRQEIETELAAYARALETRNVNEVRRVYLGLTPSQRDSWSAFFQAVGALQTILTVTALDVRGDTAEAQVNGVYHFNLVNDTTGQRQTVFFRATLTKDATGWRLVAID